MPSYSFNSTIQSIIQSIINFFEKLFGITRGQPIKTQLPPNTGPPKTNKTIGIYHPLPSQIINHLNKNKSLPKLPVLPIPIITRHSINIENLPKLPVLPIPIITRHSINIENLPKLPVLPIITRHNVNIKKLLKLPVLSLHIKIIPNKPLSQVLKNNSKTNNITNTSSTNNTSTNNTSSTNLSQIAINPNVPLSQTLTQGRTIIASKPNRNPIKNGNNGSNSSQSNKSNSKSNSKTNIFNPIKYELDNTIRYPKSINFTKSNNRKINFKWR